MARKSRKRIYAGSSVRNDQELDLLKQQKEGSALATAAYIRLSMENNGYETDDSLKTQIILVESFIRERDDLYLIDTYVDNGFSGTKFDRPEFVRMMNDVKSGRIQCIVVKDLSRFGRDYLETGYYLESILPLLNVRFIAITDQFDSIRAEDRNSISIPVKNMVNAMYAKDVSRKQEAFHEICKRNGRVVRNNAVYGYRFSEETKRLVIDQEVAPYVRMIFTWALAGVSRLEIAKRMEVIGAPTPGKYIKGNMESKWSRDTVRNILKNPAYAGFHVTGKWIASLYRGIKGKKLPRDEWIYFPDFHEPLITMDDYKTLEDENSKNRKEQAERLKVREEIRAQMQDVFQGKVFCAGCGRKMQHYRGTHHRANNDLTFQYYQCRHNNQNTGCSKRIIQQNYLKIIVMDQIRLLIQATCDKNKLLRAVQQRFEKPGTLNPVERNIGRLEEKERIIDEKILKAYMDFADTLLDEEEYLAVKEKLQMDKAVVTAKKEEYQCKLEDMKKSVTRFRELSEKLEKFPDLREFDEKLVKDLVSKIIVSADGSVEIEFSCRDVFQDALLEEFLTYREQEG